MTLAVKSIGNIIFNNNTQFIISIFLVRRIYWRSIAIFIRVLGHTIVKLVAKALLQNTLSKHMKKLTKFGQDHFNANIALNHF